MDYLRHFTRDPEICGGATVVSRTRVPVRTLLASLAEGASIGEIRSDYPTVSVDAVWAVIRWAAQRAVDASAEDEL